MLRSAEKLPAIVVTGDRDGYITDPFGHGWTIASHVEDVTPGELGRRMAELFGGGAG